MNNLVYTDATYFILAVISMFKQAQKLFLVLTLYGLAYPISASDLAKEQRWREQVVDALIDGEELLLNDGKTEFFNILTEADDPKPTAIIVLHGIGVHPDWGQVVQPLRVQLADAGWTTLSLQLPILPNEAEAKDYQPLLPEAASRIAAGIKYLQENGGKDVIVVAHSLGVTMTTHALANNAIEVKALAGIGMGPGNTAYLSKIKIPVLDLYGSDDQPDVIASAAERAKSAGSKQYKQVKVEGANHFFDDKNDELLQAVTEWINGLN